MARECRRKRDQKRFGKPNRLADEILSGSIPLACPIWMKGDPSVIIRHIHCCLEAMQERVAAYPIVCMDNVAEYYYSHNDKTEWDYLEDFPNCRPPFRDVFFEARRPALFRDRSGVSPMDGRFPSRWGVTVETLCPEALPGTTGDPVSDRLLLPLLLLPRLHAILRMMLTLVQSDNLVPAAMSIYVPIDEAGKILAHPPALSMALSPDDDLDINRVVTGQISQLFHTALLSMSFMNCRNVATAEVQPDRAVNRERHKAGLKPFLRYHTINIEPMKRVLRTEGGIEANGLKVALHICRGHFKTWTTSYFGRPLDRPVTYWTPSHVKGSTDEGVVVGDYRIR